MSKSQDLSHARQVQSFKKTKIMRKKNRKQREKFVTRVKEFDI